MHRHPVGLVFGLLACRFLFFPTLCELTAKALARLHKWEMARLCKWEGSGETAQMGSPWQDCANGKALARLHKWEVPGKTVQMGSLWRDCTNGKSLARLCKWEVSGKTAQMGSLWRDCTKGKALARLQMRRLAWACTVRLCVGYPFLVGWLGWLLLTT